MSSAFKPYLKSGDFSSEKSHLESKTKPSSKSSPMQSQPFDYTVEKLLLSSPRHLEPSSTTSPLTSLDTGRGATPVPFDVITQHLLWQQRQRQMSQELMPEAFGTANMPDMTTLFGTPHFRRFFAPHHNGQGRQSRGPRRQRTTFTHEQTLRLEMEYHVSEYISRGKRFQLAEMLDLTENQIKIWFQNRRAKDKRIEKAIVEQQYRYMTMSSATSTSASSLQAQQLNLANCSTCNYTKNQFQGNSTAVTTSSSSPSSSSDPTLACKHS